MPLNKPAYRLARAAGYSRWQAFRMSWSEFSDDPNEDQAARKRLAEAGFDVGEGPLLPDLVAEWHNLPLDADPKVRSACLTRIRRVNPPLAHRLSQDRIAELVVSDPDLSRLLAEWHALPLFDPDDDGTDEVASACLAKIRRIDPELASQLSLKRHAEMEEAALDPGGLCKKRGSL